MSNQIEKRLTKEYKKYIDSKDYKSALEVLEKLLSINPKDENYLNEKGIVLTNLGEHRQALDHFNNSFGENSNNAHMWNNKGLAHCNLHEFDNAINCFGKSYGIEGHEYASALNNEGLAHYYKGKKEKNKPRKEKNFKNAINRFNKVIEQKKSKDYEKSDAYNNKGNVLFELGWYEEASICMLESLELNPQNTNALNNRGRILASSDKYSEAIEYYNKALDIDKNHKEALNNKGIAMANLANLTDDDEYFEGAKDCYDRAINIDKNFVDAYNNKSMLYVMQGQYKKANKIIQQSLDIKEENIDTIDKKGIILFHLQKYDEALCCFKEATEKNSDNKVSRYHMGNVYMQLKKYDEAIKCFDDSLKDNFNFAEAHNAKASALFNKGNQIEASKEIKRAIEIKPSLAVANENIAKITSSSNQHFQNFWDFWKSSLFKKIVGITLVVLLLSTTISITFHIILNILSPPFPMLDMKLEEISYPYLIVLGIVLLVLLTPEIKKAKMGPVEFELEEQHIHPTQDSPSLSEAHHHTV